MILLQKWFPDEVQMLNEDPRNLAKYDSDKTILRNEIHSDVLPNYKITEPRKRWQNVMIHWRNLALSLLYLLRIFVNFVLMLAVMYFNGAVFACIVFGAAVGYFMCGKPTVPLSRVTRPLNGPQCQLLIKESLVT